MMFAGLRNIKLYHRNKTKQKLTIAVTLNENDVQIMEIFYRKAFIYRNHSVCFLHLFFWVDTKG